MNTTGQQKGTPMTRPWQPLPTGNARIALRQHAAQLYLDGCTIRSVARQIERPYTTTYELLAEAGIRFRPRGGNTRKDRP
ncbi:helix-turn-helix domain-containing protein [Streptomyces sp. NPDC008240]|uniref:helix-turn-helix domain-containing protein n=1 Tax=Streptomyces sp. NPDC008240 TaxID=3364822 RepID=UPI0036EF4BF5